MQTKLYEFASIADDLEMLAKRVAQERGSGGAPGGRTPAMYEPLAENLLLRAALALHEAYEDMVTR